MSGVTESIAYRVEPGDRPGDVYLRIPAASPIVYRIVGFDRDRAQHLAAWPD